MKRYLILLTILLALGLQPASASRPKLYFYDGDIPMVEMMLNMMSVMGMIDKVPPSLLRNGRLNSLHDYYGSSSRFRSGYLRSSPWNRRVPGFWSGALPGSGWGSGWGNGWGSDPFSRYSSSYGRLYDDGLNSFDCGFSSCDQPVSFDGIWISSSTEMLGIKRNRIIWSDGRSNTVSGSFSVSPDYITIRFDGDAATTQPYPYWLEGNQLSIKDTLDVVHRFYRLPGSNFY